MHGPLNVKKKVYLCLIIDTNLDSRFRAKSRKSTICYFLHSPHSKATTRRNTATQKRAGGVRHTGGKKFFY